ncbi:MAG: serine/threonine-protein kinase [Phycisphaerae bacterium]
MLAAEEVAIGLLDQRTHAAPVTDLSLDVERQFGRYRIERVIGTGGMGTVYEALQDQPCRTVALKVMRAGVHSQAARNRFQFETAVLGKLRHPGIAQIYDAGVQSVGAREIPYFAMEYIENAKSITAFVAENDLAHEQIISLFISVCHAVQHGHQRGVIHRDLKPDNILVEKSGQAKVIDFGVARDRT